MIKRLLQLSVLLNLVLLAMTGWRSFHNTPPPRALRSEVSQQPARDAFHASHPRHPTSIPPTPWQSIEARDPALFMAHLRAIGCPEQTIRDILILRVCREFRDRFIETEVEAEQNWEPVWNKKRWPDRCKVLSDLRNQMIIQVESLFGQSWDSLRSDYLPWFGWDEQILTQDQRRQIRDLEARFSMLKQELDRVTQATRSFDAEDHARLRELEVQKRAELAKILSPQEMEDYLYRHSDAANYVRQNLPEAKSEAEFRLMVKAAGETRMAELSTCLTSPDAAEAEALAGEQADRKAAFDKRLKELLGEDRIADLEAESLVKVEENQKQQEENALARFTAIGNTVGVPPESCRQFLNRLSEQQGAMDAKFKEIEKNLSGTPDEKSRQMKEIIRAELGRMAAETMGDKGPMLVGKMFELEH
jgi:hypothetical protein